jgi:hypothetical protein
MTKSRQRDQLLYGVLAVIFTALAFLISRNLPGRREKQTVLVPAAQETMREGTPDTLMRELQQTVDDGGKSDLKQIETEASDL